MLGLGPGERDCCSPSWRTPPTTSGARLAGASVLAADSLARAGEGFRLVWVNSPSNPTGRVLPAGHLAHGGGLGQGTRPQWWRPTSCYISLGLGGPRRSSVLHPSVCDGSHEGVPRGALAVQALQPGRFTGPGSSPATRALGRGPCLAIRKQAGMIMPGPVAGGDGAAALFRRYAHAAEQRERLRGPAVRLAGGLRRGGLGPSTTPRRASTCGPRIRRTTAGPRARNFSPPRPASWVAPGELYGPAGKTARPGGPHRHRRAHRGPPAARLRETPPRVDGLGRKTAYALTRVRAKFERCSAGALSEAKHEATVS